MKQPLVTVVLPIYNVEKYLDRCVESVVNQTYRNLEILLIDDESPDRCPQICDEWARKDSRIHVIHKRNEGQGVARNYGIEIANGEMICFLDSDDFLSLDAIEKLVRKMQERDAEMVIFGFYKTDQDGNILSTFIPDAAPPAYYNDQVQNVFLPEYIAPSLTAKGVKRFYMSSCMVLFSMKLIKENNWRYVSERQIISEDVYSLLILMQNVRAVAVLPEALYYYRTNRSSFSRSYRPDRYKKIRSFYNETVDLCKRIGYGSAILRGVARTYLAYTLATLKQETVSPYPLYYRLRVLKSIINDPVLQQALQQIQLNAVGRNRAVMFFLMRHKLYLICYFLLRIKA